MNYDTETIKQLRFIKQQIVKSNGIWNLFEDVRQAFEKEYMLAKTVCAHVVNYEERGEAFSIKGDVSNSTENRQSYQWLCEQGYFQEASLVLDGENRTVIFLTDKAITKLAQHYA